MRPLPRLFRLAPVILAGAFFLPAGAGAQSVRFKPAVARTTAQAAATGTFDVVGVMVEFQSDENRFTSGTGKFNPAYLNRTDILIDPLPHDAGYFEAHLEFAAHYFSTVSGGAVTLRTQLVPGILTLPAKMEAYAPLEGGADESYKLADLAADTWAALRDRGTAGLAGLDPDRTAWIIFHAGAGRDIELLGTTLDKTPQDIPSLYLSGERLSSLRPGRFPAAGFDAGNGLRIRNTLLVPETESRPGTDVTGASFVVQLGINGILCANLGSFLGLPDLFDPNTGQSGIGRFGLMDGAGFFAMNGVFPPEPSAWEKIFAGWITPVREVPGAERSLTLHAMSNRTLGRPVQIGEGPEYYLLENRHRNPDPAGVTLTIRKPDGSRVQRTFPPSDTGFDLMNTDSLLNRLPAGVVVAVSHYDRALPGGPDPGEDGVFRPGDRILNGGMLVWHIDESVIRSRIAANAINGDPERRGVDLEEADGAQDIGRPVAGTLGADLSGGTAFDFFWSGNDSRVILPSGAEISLYTNRFDAQSTPSTRLNSGRFAGFSLSGFSAQQTAATVTLRQTSAGVRTARLLSSSTPLPYRPAFQVWKQGADSLLAFHTGSRVVIGPADPDRFTADSVSFPALSTASLLAAHGDLYVHEPGRVRRIARSVTGWQVTWTATVPASIPIESWGGSSLYTLVRPADTLAGLHGTPHAWLRTGGESRAFPESRRVSARPDWYITESNLVTPERVLPLPVLPAGGRRLMLAGTGGALQAVIAHPGGFYIPETGAGTGFSRSQSGFLWAGTGGPYFTVSLSERAEARAVSGGLMPGWPLSFVPGDSMQAILFPSYAFFVEQEAGGFFSVAAFTPDGSRAVRLGEPLRLTLNGSGAALATAGTTLYILERNGSLHLLPAGEQALYTTRTGTPGAGNTAFFPLTLPAEQAADQPMSASETYVWPNPASETAYIRISSGAGRSIRITIADQGGRIVAERSLQAAGTGPQDVSFDIRSWPSGVYFASVRDGAVSKRIKLAVIR